MALGKETSVPKLRNMSSVRRHFRPCQTGCLCLLENDFCLSRVSCWGRVRAKKDVLGYEGAAEEEG